MNNTLCRALAAGLVLSCLAANITYTSPKAQATGPVIAFGFGAGFILAGKLLELLFRISVAGAIFVWRRMAATGHDGRTGP